MEKKYQIFVSSTYEDLKQERQIAINVIMKLGHIPAGMELFSATGEEQFESIKPVIDESDYYLIILGGKYGSVILKEKIGYTEKEFDYAVSIGKRIIAFVHSDPENLHSTLRETKPAMIHKFTKFRKKLLNNGMASMWEDRTKLAENISTSITNVINKYPESTYWVHINKNIEVLESIQSKLMNPENDLILFYSEDCFVYVTNVPGDSLVVKVKDAVNKIVDLQLKLDMVAQNDYSDKFAGYCIKDLPDDWRWLIEHNYSLKVHYQSEHEIDMWIEIKTPLVELYKKKVLLNNRDVISIDLGKFRGKKEKWVEISEMCLVFRPYHGKSVNSNIRITGIEFEKNNL